MAWIILEDMAHSSHRRWSGHCMMCAAWIRGDGRAQRLRIRDLRKIGKSRRISKVVDPDE